MAAVFTASDAPASEPDVQWHASATVNAGNGNFAPYYISSLNHGKITQPNGLLADVYLGHEIDTTKRFSWSAAFELCAGAASSTEYLRWNADGLTTLHPMRPAHIRIQQFYAQIKYHGVFLTAGMKEHQSALLDNSLTSGDLVESGNARPIPEIRMGFINFQNIPFTQGWAQIQGEIAWGKFLDNKWLEDFYSYGTAHINTGALYLYRRLYLRSKPSENFCFTFGMQAAGQIGGTTRWYRRGELTLEEKNGTSFTQLLKMVFPFQTDTGVGEYKDGNNLGSWDFLLRYKLPYGRNEIRAYLQKPWEKGSSIGWHNGWDGLWGVEFITSGIRHFEAVVFEYLTFMNQSGPIHYAPHDNPGSTITSDISGHDDYYNNYQYNSYAYYGVGIGTPFLPAPIYNTDGYPLYANNLIKGFHMGARGNITNNFRWKAAISYRKAFGNIQLPSIKPLDDFSWLLQADGFLPRLPALNFSLQVAMDHGSLLGNNFGIAIGATYNGDFNFRKK